jgi:spore coat protein U-like protein
MNNIAKTSFVVAAAITLTLGTFASVLSSEASAQANSTGSNATSIGPKFGSQKILVNPINFTGTIPLRSTINKAISSVIKVPLIEAVSTAQKLIGSNSSPTLAVLRPLIGYLVYDVHVRNNSNNTSYAVIIDPGNGQVLYHQALTPFSMAGHSFMFAKGGYGGFYAGHKGG